VTFKFARTRCQPCQVWFCDDLPAARTGRAAAFRSKRHGAALPNSGLLRPAFEPGAQRRAAIARYRYVPIFFGAVRELILATPTTSLTAHPP
jgi:hypothetical protein